MPNESIARESNSCNLNTHSNMHPIVKINMLFASWDVRIGKNCDQGL